MTTALATIAERTERFDTREEWLARRRLSLGSSDLAAIVGLSPWQSPLSVWLDKTGKDADQPISEAQEERFWWGHAEEPLIAERFAMKTGRRVIREPFTIVRHPRLHFIHSSPDGWLPPEGFEQSDEPFAAQPWHEGTADFEAKVDSTIGRFGKFEEGNPQHYRIQALDHLACSGRAECLFGVRTLSGFLWLREERNDEIISWLESEAERFWTEHVQADQPPLADGTEASVRALKLLHPEDDGSTIELPPEAEDWHREFEAQKALVRAHEKARDQAKAKLIQAIGGSTFGTLPAGGGYSLKTQERAEYVAKASKFRVLRFSKKLGGGR